MELKKLIIQTTKWITMTAVKSSLLSFDITEVFYQIEGTGFHD